ncbi:MAG: WhiB family transcriptional regulator, partial [Acidimicrobiales bacterium]
MTTTTTLGPIGHLPVDGERARNAAAGPRVTMTSVNVAAFRPVSPPPVAVLKRGEHEFVPADWAKHANCAGTPTSLMFPERGEPMEEAKALCAACIVRG